jgi:hypothetical protein
MPNVINYAEKWQPEIIKTLAENAFSARYVTQNVRWLDAKTFHFTTLATGGYGNHSRAADGWNSSIITQSDVPFTLSHDRSIELFVDRADVDESNTTAAAQNVTEVFTREHQTPEMDARFFSIVAQKAIANSLYVEETLAVADVFTKIKAAIKNVRRYRSTLEVFVSSDAMDLLERSTELSKRVEITNVAPGGFGVETRVTAIDGIPVYEVTDYDRFYSIVKYSVNTNAGEAGFNGDIAESSQLNYVICDTERVVTVPKIATIYFFEPGSHTKGDGYLYQNRSLWDTFVFPDGVRGIKSIYASFDMRVLGVTSVAGTLQGNTKITLDSAIGNTGSYSYVYKTAADVAIPAFGADLSTWTAWNGTADITATTGHDIVIAVVDANDLCYSAGLAIVVSAA